MRPKAPTVKIPLPPADPAEQARRRRAAAAARSRTIDQWRGRGFTSAETAWISPAKSIETILPGVLGHLRLEQRLDESKIQTIWSQILDPTLVAHAQPAGFAKGTWFVNVDSSVWLNEIVRYRRQEILERLQTALGKTVVQKISFRVG
jgi:predicted nucleic acid-binding Zn ribbon protein